MIVSPSGAPARPKTVRWNSSVFCTAQMRSCSLAGRICAGSPTATQPMVGAGLAQSPYVAARGMALQRAGRVYLRKDGEDIWVGGEVVEVIRGEINLWPEASVGNARLGPIAQYVSTYTSDNL